MPVLFSWNSSILRNPIKMRRHRLMSKNALTRGIFHLVLDEDFRWPVSCNDWLILNRMSWFQESYIQARHEKNDSITLYKNQIHLLERSKNGSNLLGGLLYSINRMNSSFHLYTYSRASIFTAILDITQSICTYKCISGSDTVVSIGNSRLMVTSAFRWPFHPDGSTLGHRLETGSSCEIVSN